MSEPSEPVSSPTPSPSPEPIYDRLFPRKPWKWWAGVAAGVVVLAGAVGMWFGGKTIPSSGGLWFPTLVSVDVPAFAQGDLRWKDDLLGATEATLHAEGCAVTSAAMVLASYGMDIDPGRLNRFLQEHPQGYTPEGWIYWEAAADFAPGITEKVYEDLPSRWLIDWNLLRGNPVIVRVRLPANTHFVVIAGKKGWDYLVLDPGGQAGKGLVPLKQLAPRIEALRYYRQPESRQGQSVSMN